AGRSHGTGGEVRGDRPDAAGRYPRRHRRRRGVSRPGDHPHDRAGSRRGRRAHDVTTHPQRSALSPKPTGGGLLPMAEPRPHPTFLSSHFPPTGTAASAWHVPPPDERLFPRKNCSREANYKSHCRPGKGRGPRPTTDELANPVDTCGRFHTLASRFSRPHAVTQPRKGCPLRPVLANTIAPVLSLFCI